MSTSIQPLSSIGPADPEKAREEELKKDPAKRDYLQGREELKKGDYTMAAMSFHNALKGFEEKGDEQGVANASDRLGDVCLEKKDFTAALEHYQRAYTICEKEEDSFSTLALNKKIAAIYREQGELNKAMEVLFDMVEHYQLTRNPKGMVEVMVVIAELYREKGEPLKAADTYRTVSSIHKNFKHKRMSEEFAALADELEQA
ncbi:MAG: tetratricopeptide repeat protein [Candidatus Electrothrix sp. LOE1_4_5]|mgnify:CR=1 FL=1|jgi:tetratricopeptide (TPR) repeat protein|nr:tetratricopeptide repeat protein [Candidatus Electrothrix gigas]MCI5190180.1 tetratricopeptide repeat protein [Candidatus Electrothrix gigas]MCI5192388.1 tetratricopeptide repeat protein [Candidatus Electrothrix gigas]